MNTKRKPARIPLYFTCLALLISSCEAAQEDPLVLTLDPSRTYQTMEGFGASDAWRCQFVGKNWPEVKKEYIADLLFSRDFDSVGNPKGIGLSIWRFYLGSGTTELGDSSEIINEWRRAECFQLPDGRYDWTKQEGQRWFLKAARKRGVEKYLAFSITPPVHMSKNGKGHSPKGDIRMNIGTERMDDYARFMADVLQYFSEQGEPFDYLSPFNEPQWDWDQHTQEGTAAQNEDLYELIRALSQQLIGRGLSTEIVAGEAATMNHLSGIVKGDSRDNQIEVFFGKESPMNIASLPHVRKAITAHSYFTTWPLDTLLVSRRRLTERLLQTDQELEYWQTEFCILEKNPEIGQGSKRDLGMPTALYVARVIHSDLVMNHACSWQWWTALSQCDYKDGLVYLDSGYGSGMTDPRSAMNDSLKYDGVVRKSKLLWALGNYSRFIRPGSKRIDTHFSESHEPLDQLTGVMASAYHDPDKKRYVLVAVNQTPQPQKMLLLDKDGRKVGQGKRIETYTTSEKKDLNAGHVYAPMLDLDPSSVTTFLIPEAYLLQTN